MLFPGAYVLPAYNIWAGGCFFLLIIFLRRFIGCFMQADFFSVGAYLVEFFFVVSLFLL
jgi:hypothetical protein